MKKRVTIVTRLVEAVYYGNVSMISEILENILSLLNLEQKHLLLKAITAQLEQVDLDHQIQQY